MLTKNNLDRLIWDRKFIIKFNKCSIIYISINGNILKNYKYY